MLIQLAAKLGLSPAMQARLLRLQITLIGLGRDYWKDAPYEWPAWMRKGKAPRNAPPPKVVATPKPKREQSQEATPAQPQEAKTSVRAAPKSWTADRVQIMEQMWGEGNSFPGGEEYIEALSSPLGINQDMSVLDLGAGLGALSRYLAHHHNAYVTGLEQDSTLASRGMVLSIAAGKSKQASVNYYDPVNYSASRKYDCIFAREVFYRIIGKEKFIKAVDSSLKTGGGQIVFTDYVLDPASREKPGVTQWLGADRGAAPLSMLETIKLWKGMGYDLRIAEDQTETYKVYILHGLQQLAAHMVSNIPDHDTKLLVAREVDLWARRIRAFGDGLKYCRFFGIKY